MKFLIIKEIGHGNKNRVCLGEFIRNDHPCNDTLFLAALIKVTEDFDESLEFCFVRDNDSIQYRPKSIFENSKGFYYKLKNKAVYLSDNESIELKQFVEKFKKEYELLKTLDAAYE